MLHLGICVIRNGAYPFHIYTMSRYNVAVVYIDANSMFWVHFSWNYCLIFIGCNPSFCVVLNTRCNGSLRCNKTKKEGYGDMKAMFTVLLLRVPVIVLSLLALATFWMSSVGCLMPSYV